MHVYDTIIAATILFIAITGCAGTYHSILTDHYKFERDCARTSRDTYKKDVLDLEQRNIAASEKLILYYRHMVAAETSQLEMAECLKLATLTIAKFKQEIRSYRDHEYERKTDATAHTSE